MAASSKLSSKDGVQMMPITTTTTTPTTNAQEIDKVQQHKESEYTMEAAEALQELQQNKTPTQVPYQNGRSSKITTSKRTKALKFLKWVVRDQWFLIAMAAVILLASQVQVPASRQKTKRTVITYLSVSVIFFINGCTLETSILLENSMRWKLHAFVQLQCYLVCSAATFAIVSLCATNKNFMDPWLLIGFLFVGSAPTTMNSNVVSWKYRPHSRSIRHRPVPLPIPHPHHSSDVLIFRSMV
jgi:sodium/bile acid cotransporter 7